MSILAAITITLLVANSDGNVTKYPNVPNDQGAPVSINRQGTTASIEVDGVLCNGTVNVQGVQATPLSPPGNHVSGMLTCADNGVAVVDYGETQQTQKTGRYTTRKWWRLNGGTIERP